MLLCSLTVQLFSHLPAVELACFPIAEIDLPFSCSKLGRYGNLVVRRRSSILEKGILGCKGKTQKSKGWFTVRESLLVGVELKY